MYSWWWVELSPETCKLKPLQRINAIVASCWIYFTTSRCELQVTNHMMHRKTWINMALYFCVNSWNVVDWWDFVNLRGWNSKRIEKVTQWLASQFVLSQNIRVQGTGYEKYAYTIFFMNHGWHRLVLWLRWRYSSRFNTLQGMSWPA